MTPLEQLASYAQVMGCEIVTLRQEVPSTGEPAMLLFRDPPKFKREAEELRQLLGKQARERSA